VTASSIEIPGFADPVGEAQATFRAVLDAMARPGRIYTCADGLNPPTPLGVATASVALALIDQETTLFLDATMRPAGAWLQFHAGAPIIEDHTGADFLLVSSCPDLATLRTGTDEAPQASATLILQVASLGTGVAYRLSGPGHAKPSILRATGLPDDFATLWGRNHKLFPRGVDIVLCAGNRLAALPRSIALEIA
jgi:alpha-D-ribose 1-methylphosphonate 5-triphosphate synthase subunit PhnH